MRAFLIGFLGLCLVLGGVALRTQSLAPTERADLVPTERPDIASYDFAVMPGLSGFGDPRLQRRRGDDDIAFARRVNGVVHEAAYHCLDNSATQSWLITAVSGIGLQLPEEQGILSAFRFECGLCHQAAYIAARAMRNGGLEAEAYGLDGHVVTRVETSEGEYFFDADYGVGPIPFTLAERAAAVVKAYDGVVPDVVRTRLVEIYSETKGDESYYSNAYLDEISDRQEMLLRLESGLEVAAVGGGGALVLFAVIGMPRRRASRRRGASAGQHPTTA